MRTVFTSSLVILADLVVPSPRSRLVSVDRSVAERDRVKFSLWVIAWFMLWVLGYRLEIEEIRLHFLYLVFLSMSGEWKYFVLILPLSHLSAFSSIQRHFLSLEFFE